MKEEDKTLNDELIAVFNSTNSELKAIKRKLMEIMPKGSLIEDEDGFMTLRENLLH